MQIKIGVSTSEKERLSKNFTEQATLDAEIKQPSSIIDPTFIIKTPNNININYVKCPYFGRNYFVNNITLLPGGRVELNCHVDVLSSFASSIRGCGCIIDKQQYDAKSNKYINDGSYVMEAKSVLSSINFPVGFDSQSTILITAGGN